MYSDGNVLFFCFFLIVFDYLPLEYFVKGIIIYIQYSFDRGSRSNIRTLFLTNTVLHKSKYSVFTLDRPVGLHSLSVFGTESLT